MPVTVPFMDIHSFKDNRHLLLLFPFYRWWNWGTENLDKLAFQGHTALK